MKKLIIEFIGTFFLILVIGLSGNPLAIGGILMVMVYMGGHISGAHYNPAVSLALLLRGKLSVVEMLKYWAAQLSGAILGGALSFWLSTEPTSVVVGEGYTILQALTVEVIFTFALASVVLHVATTKQNAGNSFYGLAIGFTVFAAAMAGGNISGGAFNPAVAIGHTVWTNDFSSLWIYFVGPFIGAAIAASVFKIVSPDDFN